MKDILLIDGMNLFIRNFSIINTINTNGVHIGGLIGFLKSIGYNIKLFRPSKIVVCFEGKNSSQNRRNILPSYKSNRKGLQSNKLIYNSHEEEKTGIEEQLNRLKEYLSFLPISVISIDNMEGDDVISILTKQLKENNKIKIISCDKDYFQLIEENVEVHSPCDKITYNTKKIVDKFSIHPNNFINYKCITGDSSDNIQGIYGIGDKKIIKLFPELINENQLNINDIINISEERKKENKLYNSIIENKNILEQNKKIISLTEQHHLPNDVEKILELYNKKTLLNLIKFMNLHFEDNINNNISTNIQNWLTYNFGYLAFQK